MLLDHLAQILVLFSHEPWIGFSANTLHYAHGNCGNLLQLNGQFLCRPWHEICSRLHAIDGAFGKVQKNILLLTEHHLPERMFDLVVDLLLKNSWPELSPLRRAIVTGLLIITTSTVSPTDLITSKGNSDQVIREVRNY